MPALISFMRPDAAGPAGCVVDDAASAAHARAVVRAGCSGVVIAGTTGQSATLTHDEQIRLAGVVAAAARDEARRLNRVVRVVISAGSNATHEACSLSANIIREASPDALLHVTGYYNNPPQEGLLKHFTMVADLAATFDTGIILYNVPTRTRSHIEAETVARLAKHPAIVAIKEASGDTAHLRRIVETTDRNEFALISGEDHLVADVLDMGGVGVISASANVWPGHFQAICDLHRSGDKATAHALQKALLPCVEAVFCVKNPIPVHYMLGSPLRPPLVSVEELEPAHRAKCEAKIQAALALRDFPGLSAVQSMPLTRFAHV